MKKLLLVFSLVLSFSLVSLPKAEAEYLSQYDKYVEITPEQGAEIAKLLGITQPLSYQTALLTFNIQEAAIAKLETIIGKEIDHYYIWLTINGVPVLAIDPPVAYY